MLQGLHYMHSLGIVHRDLKLENILMHDVGGGNMEVKIADFGLSCLLVVGEHGYDASHSAKRKKYDKCEDMWGTREYFAPELIAGNYGPQVCPSVHTPVAPVSPLQATFSSRLCINAHVLLSVVSCCVVL
jgi:serine/threonine protein kinase